MSKFLHRLLSASILTLLLSIVSAVSAQYKPPSNQRPPRGNSISSGHRGGGCLRIAQIPLTTLAPQKYVGHSVSSRPTFAWFVPDTESYKIEFALYEYSANNNKKLITRIPLESSPGIMKLSLPETIPDLTVGKSYLWQVAIICNENSPSTDLIASAEIEITELKADVKRSLDAAKEPLKKAEVYANAGLWYDALREALTADNTPESRAMISNLLEEVADMESSEVSKKLLQIANIKRRNTINSGKL
jgi:hypothetical protein